MNKIEQILRKHIHVITFGSHDEAIKGIDPKDIPAIASEIEAEYYEKEFVEWFAFNVESKPIQYRLFNGKIFLNISEVYKYWKTQIQNKNEKPCD